LDALNAWVKQIILIVLFAAFLELLIPGNSYKKIVRLIMGLFILLTVMRPLLHVLEPWGDDVAVKEVAVLNVDNKAAILNQAAKIQNERERIAFAQYRRELIKQIKVLVGTVDGISAVTAEIVLNEGNGEKSGGTLKSVTIYVKPEQSAQQGALVAPVKPVDVPGAAKGQKGNTVLTEQKQEQIKRVVAEFYHLKTGQVIVYEAK